ncbi:hypothetical protein DHEL01_v201163 [Diaporthe helianthi]|uniref:Uncharacterized protein n=1 Tax=Diaporthe helianthi TaxID=158607 RepID=A0A2P5ID53_DIAHE|nr:hypothetical protein DHEL01_v201163 [Diaporthe helianthi]
MENTQLQGGPSSAPDRQMTREMEMEYLRETEHLRFLYVEGESRKRAAEPRTYEQTMAEAARALKRRRMTPDADFSGARKMFAYGPEEQPDGLEGKRRTEMADLMFDNVIMHLPVDFDGTYSSNSHDIRYARNMSKPDFGPTYKPGFNLLESVCSSVWLAIEVAKHLRPADIVNLYSTSKSFHNVLNQHWQSSIVAWAEHMAPSSFRIFYWKFFGCYTRTDPTGTTWEAPGQFANAIPHPPWAEVRPTTDADKEVRSVPGLRYLAMVVKREARVRDILAKLARQGHRLPSKCHEAVKKMWLLMDLPTNRLRRAFIRSTELWTTEDIFNAQMFVTKLQMRFNEPVFGPDSPQAVEAFLGSARGLNPLWEMFRGKKYTEILEAVQLRVNYIASDQAIRRFRNWAQHYDMPEWALGRGHLEGWGQGNVHLSRPDELLIEEAIRRNLNLKDHFTYMTFWGHVDWRKRANLVPTEEEMYMSDDELPALTDLQKGPNGIFGNCGNVPFDSGEWKPQHALLARWATLTEQQKQGLWEYFRQEQIKMAPMEDDDDGFWYLREYEQELLTAHQKPNTSIDAEETYDREGEPEPDADEDSSENEPAEMHDENCMCMACQPDFDTASHDGSCFCEECQDEADFWAEQEDVERQESGDEDEQDGNNAQQQQQQNNANTLAILPPVPMPQEILQNSSLLDAWNSLGFVERQMVNNALANQRDIQRFTARIPKFHIPIRQFRFPKIRDAVSLILAHKVNDIGVGPAGEGEGQGEVSSGAASENQDDDDDDDDMEDVEVVDEGYDSNHAGDGDGDGANQDGDDASSDSSMDDEQLKALADVEYSDEDLNFDMGGFQALLKRGRDDGSYHYSAGGDGDEDEDALGMAHEDDLKSPGLAAEMQLPDVANY